MRLQLEKNSALVMLRGYDNGAEELCLARTDLCLAWLSFHRGPPLLSHRVVKKLCVYVGKLLGLLFDRVLHTQARLQGLGRVVGMRADCSRHVVVPPQSSSRPSLSIASCAISSSAVVLHSNDSSPNPYLLKLRFFTSLAAGCGAACIWTRRFRGCRCL